MKKFFLIIFIFQFYSSQAQWIEYMASDNSFQLSFPGQPDVIGTNEAFGTDNMQIIRYFQIDSLNSGLFQIIVQNLSQNTLKPEFDENQKYEVLKGIANAQIGLTGEVLKSGQIFYKDYPGISVEGEIRQAINEPPYPPVFVKSYLVGNRIYTLKITCADDNMEDSSIDRFFNSFEIIE